MVAGWVVASIVVVSLIVIGILIWIIVDLRRSLNECEEKRDDCLSDLAKCRESGSSSTNGQQ